MRLGTRYKERKINQYKIHFSIEMNFMIIYDQILACHKLILPKVSFLILLSKKLLNQWNYIPGRQTIYFSIEIATILYIYIIIQLFPLGSQKSSIMNKTMPIISQNVCSVSYKQHNSPTISFQLRPLHRVWARLSPPPPIIWPPDLVACNLSLH